jgi:hypothetical protein
MLRIILILINIEGKIIISLDLIRASDFNKFGQKLFQLELVGFLSLREWKKLGIIKPIGIDY